MNVDVFFDYTCGFSNRADWRPPRWCATGPVMTTGVP